MKVQPLYADAERPALGFYFVLCVVCAVVMYFALRYAAQIDRPRDDFVSSARLQGFGDCRVFTTRDAGYRAQLIECTLPARAAR